MVVQSSPAMSFTLYFFLLVLSLLSPLGARNHLVICSQSLLRQANIDRCVGLASPKIREGTHERLK